MANPEHVEIVLRGSEAIREWREAHPDERLDLIGANLSEANLIGANLSEANLSWADLSGANLIGANLIGADLGWADLSWADLRWANLSRADLSRADLSEANLSGAIWCGATLDGARLSPNALGGPGEILCALTPLEWERVREERAVEAARHATTDPDLRTVLGLHRCDACA